MSLRASPSVMRKIFKKSSSSASSSEWVIFSGRALIGRAIFSQCSFWRVSEWRWKPFFTSRDNYFHHLIMIFLLLMSGWAWEKQFKEVRPHGKSGNSSPTFYPTLVSEKSWIIYKPDKILEHLNNYVKYYTNIHTPITFDLPKISSENPYIN